MGIIYTVGPRLKVRVYFNKLSLSFPGASRNYISLNFTVVTLSCRVFDPGYIDLCYMKIRTAIAKYVDWFIIS